ncbi:hypothetical protein BKA60DRAFT_656351 [Fusarium oxysporum]|nr:hypothetical protein BKA60DRAFT_656351 [Fusarium oxysporum]
MATSIALQALPSELIGAICRLLPNCDIKSLRLTCRYWRQNSLLRFDRVFISANPRNAEVLFAVTNHDIFRHRVKEIMWDDAVLEPVSSKEGDGPCGYSSYETDRDADSEEKGRISRYFVRLCRDSMFDGTLRLRDKTKEEREKYMKGQMNDLLPSRESLAYYSRLLQEQSDILESGDDEAAFRYAVQRFPRLTKVTVTPATHGVLITPLYETPMVRGFPRGFVYPIPRGWPCAENEHLAEEANPWEAEDEKNKWRGFRIVTRVLAQAENCQISELVLDNNKLPTGLNHFVFEEPNEEYDNFCRIVQRPGSRRIVLSLLVDYLFDCDTEGWDFYRNGRISNLLAKAPDLQEVVLQTNYPDDLICFLSKLSSTLQSIELSFLSVLNGLGNHAGILTDIRDKLGWIHRPVDKRIKICLSVRLNQPDFGRYACFDKEVHEGGSYAMFSLGKGIQYDEFDESFMIVL